jgi:guanidinopropionase
MSTERHEDQFEIAQLASQFCAWHGVSTFYRCPYQEDPRETDIAIVGVPYTAGNIIERGQYMGPRAIRNASGGHRRGHRELRVDTFGLCRIHDLGDVPVHNMVNPLEAERDVQRTFERIDAAQARPMAVGGDHGVTLPILRAIAGPTSRLQGPVAVVLFDSHTDAYDPVDRTEHGGSWAKTGVADGLIDADRSLMIGLNGGLALLDMEEWARERYRVIDLDEFDTLGVDGVVGEIRKRVGDAPVYVTLDLDAIELSEAPAVSNPELGGIRAHDLQKVIRGMRGLKIVGSDIVEFCGRKQGDELTAFTAAILGHELLTVMAEGDTVGSGTPS